MRRPPARPEPIDERTTTLPNASPQPAVAVIAALLSMLLVASCSLASTAPIVTPAPSVAPSPTPEPCPRSPDDETTCIVVLGDSIASGDGAADDPDRWPARLEALLHEVPERDIVVSNWAHGGSKIDLLERRVAELPLQSYRVAIVITGVNDTADRTVGEWAPRYAAAISKLEEAGLTVVIGTAPPTYESGVFTDRFAAVAEELRKIAGDRPMLDIAKDWQDLGVDTAGPYYIDLIHQNSLGQAAMAEKARSVVESILASSSEVP
jgi:lysophospholipase L1-like esterase